MSKLSEDYQVAKENQSELYQEVLAAFESDQTQTKFTRSVKKVARPRTRRKRRSKSEAYSTDELLKLVKCQQIRATKGLRKK